MCNGIRNIKYHHKFDKYCNGITGCIFPWWITYITRFLS